MAFFDGNMLDACLRFDAADVIAHPEELVDLCADMSASRCINNAILIAYEVDAALVDTGRESLFARLCAASSIPIHHCLEVNGERWRVCECHTACCDMNWQIRDDPRSVAPVAEMVMQGIAPLKSRDAALEVLNRRDLAGMTSVKAAITELDRTSITEIRRRDHSDCAWCQFVEATDVEEYPLARVLLRLEDRLRRDEAICSLIPELASATAPWFQSPSVPDVAEGFTAEACHIGDEARCLSQLLNALPLVPESLRATWLCLIALARWRGGDQSGAAMAASCALDKDTNHSLARLCTMILEVRRPYREFCSAPNRTASSL